MQKISCWAYILVGVLAVLPILTGDGAGEIIKTYPGINNDLIENHETFGYILFYGILTNGVLAIAALWFSRKNSGIMKKINTATLVIAILLLVPAYQTGLTGGNIRHPEIEQGALVK